MFVAKELTGMLRMYDVQSQPDVGNANLFASPTHFDFAVEQCTSSTSRSHRSASGSVGSSARDTGAADDDSP